MHRLFCLLTNAFQRWLASFALAVLCLAQAHAQPVLLSTSPANGATGVSASTPIVFTFSEEMDTSSTATYATFVDMSSPMTQLALTPSWNSGMTVLTYTPTQPFPVGDNIWWFVTGQSLFGDPFNEEMGSFTVADGGGSTCTDPVGAFTIGKGAAFTQATAGPPTRNTNAPYVFVACLTVACSNRPAGAVTLTLPTGLSTNVSFIPGLPGHGNLTEIATNEADFESAHPSGNYVFQIQQAVGSLPFTVNSPSTLVQPNAPHISNFAASQAIDPSKPFTLTWDPFTGGTAADCVYVELYGGVFKTGASGEAGALGGTATSVVIPAGTLEPNQSYPGCITFYDQVLLTNSAVSFAYRGTTTEFTLLTTGGGTPAPAPTIASPGARNGKMSFEVISAPGQALTVESSPTMLPGSWQSLATTNCPADRVLIVDPRPMTGSPVFYRVRNGS